MDGNMENAESKLELPQIRQTAPPTVADQVFEELRQNILSLKLPPDTKISETEVARQMGVSRQPVREAFKRLAKLGFLKIRPQSGTKVSLISAEAVTKARFIRMALEIHTCRKACEGLSDEGSAKLQSLVDEQEKAFKENDKERFHEFDDQFHQEICIQSGVGYVWDLIRDSKGHMDRIRVLTLNYSSQRIALEEHKEILKAIVERDADAATTAFTKHLSRILGLVEEIKSRNHRWFTENET